MYLFFVNKKQWCHFGKGTQCGTVLREMLTKLFVRSYFQQNKLSIYFFSFLWHKIIVLISNMFICEDCNSKFVAIHVDTFGTPHLKLNGDHIFMEGDGFKQMTKFKFYWNKIEVWIISPPRNPLFPFGFFF